MKNEEYWERKFLALEELSKNDTEEYFAALAIAFSKTIKKMEGEIASWYAKHENITYAEAKRRISKMEAEELGRMVSNLKFIQIKLDEAIDELYEKYEESVTEHLTDTYEEQYYQASYEIQKGAETETPEVSKLDPAFILAAIMAVWATDGLNFIQRIDRDKSKLKTEVENLITRGVITGATPQQVIKAVSDRVKVAQNNASRLVSTETSFVRSAAHVESYKTLKVERYKISATLDQHTTQICRQMDGKIFKRSEYQVGVTANPFHPRCRTTTVPYFGFEYGERVGRDKEGNRIYVPSSMTYKEWYKTFIDV